MWVITRLTLMIILLLFASIANASVVYPSVIDIKATQGQSENIDINVQNNESEEKQYAIELVNVTLGNEEDEYAFSDLGDEKKSWFELNNQNFSLLSQEQRNVEIIFTPDENASSETFIVGVNIIEEPIEGGQISVRTGIMTLLFITVGDDVPYNVKWVDYQIKVDKFTNEINSYLTVENLDAGILQPDGVVQIKNIFGKVTEEAILNPELKRIPTGQIRTFIVNQSLPWALGPYEISLYVMPWDNAEVYSTSQTVWLYSWKSLLVIGFVSLMIIVIWRYARRSKT